jgi:hypothetical protein
MKTIAILLVSITAVAGAQTREPETKRLRSVNWDLTSHKLVWVVQTGSVENGEFKSTSSDTYEISPDKAVMTYAGERRGFTAEEAVVVHKLLDTLSLYCAESVVWWDKGQGVKLDPKSNDKDKKKEQPKRDIVKVSKEPAPYIAARLQ